MQNEKNKYTNISTEPLGILDGIPVKPCMKSGFCCTKAPCGYGELSETGTGCKFLGPPNDIGQRDCMKYEEIIKMPGAEFMPGFGSGCCMGLFNEMRDKVIENINKKLK